MPPLSHRQLHLVFLLLFSALAISGCNRCNSTDEPLQPSGGGASSGVAQTPTVTITSEYGGLYSIGGKTLDTKEMENKVKEFNAIRSSIFDWDSSRAVVLDSNLFVNSINMNQASGVPQAETYQRYNYVVKDHQIRVAVWTKDTTVGNVCGKATVSSKEYADAHIYKGKMVNFFPEDTNLPFALKAKDVPPKVCVWAWEKPDSSKTTGVLDGHSKHFMLAQDPLMTLGKYKPPKNSDYKDIYNGSGREWAKAKVQYAGEIIVDVKNCYYIINQGSGTYRPSGGPNHNFDYLKNLADLFKASAGAPPAAVWDMGKPLDPVMTISPDSVMRFSGADSFKCKKSDKPGQTTWEQNTGDNNK